ncbi:MAG: hypothetical protein OXN97_24215 [Bryobacterales bacterium]|nr:hypothetical protein [Bryobacterales bacterium]
MEAVETPADRGPLRSVPLSRPPTPARGCSLHPDMESRDGVLPGVLRIHGIPPAAPAQTGTEFQCELPHRALAELHEQLRDLLERYPS